MLSGIPGTSLWGLKARSEEHERAEALFKDVLAHQWFQQLEPFFSPELARWYSSTLQRSIALRTDILDRAVRMHIQQYDFPVVVEMGAGFSTRYHRVNPQKGAWYEWDLPQMIEVRMGLKESPTQTHGYLAYSITDSDALDTLEKALGGFDTVQVLFIAEGLFMYFERNVVEQVLKDLQQRFQGAKIAFDVLGKLNFKAAQAPGEDVDAPVYWGVADTRSLLLELGLFETDMDLTLPAQIKRYSHYQYYLKPLERWLLSQRWLTRKMGGTLLGQF